MFEGGDEDCDEDCEGQSGWREEIAVPCVRTPTPRQMQVMSFVMFKSLDPNLKTLSPFRFLPDSRQREIPLIVKQNVEILLDLFKTMSKIGLVGTIKARM
ncbi:hypothetical protein TCAL_15996, partial [Tigriopus californicus]